MDPDTDSKPVPSMTLEDLVAAAEMGKALEELAKAHPNHWLDGKFRLWNANGWSPGYFEFEEDFVLFYADYEEQ